MLGRTTCMRVFGCALHARVSWQCTYRSIHDFRLTRYDCLLDRQGNNVLCLHGRM